MNLFIKVPSCRVVYRRRRGSQRGEGSDTNWTLRVSSRRVWVEGIGKTGHSPCPTPSSTRLSVTRVYGSDPGLRGRGWVKICHPNSFFLKDREGNRDHGYFLGPLGGSILPSSSKNLRKRIVSLRQV